MPLSKDEVRHIALLARLKLTPDEIERFADELTVVVEYFDKLKSVDTAGVEPRDQFINAENVFREDRIVPSLPRDKALANAPDIDKDNQYFHVPKVIG